MPADARRRGGRPRALPHFSESPRWRTVARAAALAGMVAAAACAPKPIVLPTGTSTPLGDRAPIEGALARCAALKTVTAEIGLSGKVGSQRLRGRLQAGFAAPDGIRLEAVAPFGAPFFILAGKGGTATLLLARDDRVLRGAPPAGILDALAGLDVAPGDLGAWLAGCPSTDLTIESARAYGGDWIAADLAGNRVLWLHRQAAWRPAALVAGAMTVEFLDYTGGAPGRVRIRRAAADAGAGATAVDVRLTLAQVETNVPLGEEAFRVDVPPGTEEITLDDLRANGPLRAARE